MNKLVKKSIVTIYSSFLLCSYTKSASLAKYGYSDSFDRTSYYDRKGEQHEVRKIQRQDLGRRNGAIGQYIEFSVEQYWEYLYSDNRYILQYEPVFLNPKAITSYSETLTYTISEDYSFAYTKAIKFGLSNAIYEGIKLKDFAKVSNEKSSTVSVSMSSTFTQSYGRIVSSSKTVSFNLNAVPDGYVFSPCITCNAVVRFMTSIGGATMNQNQRMKSTKIFL
mgnify:CR=1 FL=1